MDAQTKCCLLAVALGNALFVLSFLLATDPILRLIVQACLVVAVAADLLAQSMHGIGKRFDEHERMRQVRRWLDE